MVRLSRKQQEIREREGLILELARGLLLERGYLGLTMDRIARAAEVSKGTIYQHFANKEEVVTALAIRTMRAQAALFERAAMFRGRPRERMVAIGYAHELFVRLRPDDFRCSLIIKTASIRDKVSPDRCSELAGCEQRCMGTVSGIVRDAIAAGELPLGHDVHPEAICFGLWSMTFGAFALVSFGIPLQQYGIEEPYSSVMRNCHALMDGFAWRPLLSEHDYEATLARIAEEVFSDEHRRLEEARA